MYRDAVEQAIQDDITAAAAAHRELGRDYDSAVAESLVDRIGTEIDKRIDARLGSPRSDAHRSDSHRSDSPRSDSRPPVTLSSSGTTPLVWIGAGVGAGLTGLVAMIANDGNTGPNSGAVTTAVIWVWVILAVAALGTVVVRKYRGR